MYAIKSSPVLAALAFAAAAMALAPLAPVITAAPDGPEARALMLGLDFGRHVMAQADSRVPNFFSVWYDPKGNLSQSDECASKYSSLEESGPSIGSALAMYILSTYVRTATVPWVYISSAGHSAGFACDPAVGNPPATLSSAWESYTDAYSTWKSSAHSEGHVLATSCSGVFEPFFDYAVATDAAECSSELLAFNQQASETATETSSTSFSSGSPTLNGISLELISIGLELSGISIEISGIGHELNGIRSCVDGDGMLLIRVKNVKGFV
ncbi:hypothetical protein B0T22DRAFT_536739 [Podospora appendiculata]|uniref:Uncharacterized protein n=1 Tax=Podospora appendiculata TaxID=314037 RepID=A0AAE0XCK0_9PEZI|nr:hypothetical protein B0T22DRAFT_536739 [Podospora appendiculata]